MPTAEQQALIEAIGRVLSADPAIEAAWLAGSLGRNAGDAFSDIDILALVGEGPPAEVGRRYADGGVGAIAEPVLVMPLFGARVVSVVTETWERFDLSFIEASELERYDAARLIPIFNRSGREPPTREPAAYRATPQSVLSLVNEFLRCLGLAVGAFGREEWILAQWGVDILRRLTLDLMLEENGVSPADRGGALRRNPLLTAEQRRSLEALTPVAATRDSILVANAELAALFLPRAKRLADEVGAEWPTAFEAATRKHLQEGIGLSI